MIEKVKAWVASHSAETHSIAVAISVVFLAYFQVPAVHDYVNTIFGELPKGLRELIATVIAFILWYRGQQQKAS